MKKSILTTLFLILFISFSNAQSDCKKLNDKIKTFKTELEKKNNLISSQKLSISKLKKDNEYFRKTLGLLNSTVSTENKNVSFKINSIVGYSNTGKIIIEGILVNKGVVRSLQVMKAEATDLNGNVSTTYKLKVGGKDIRISKLLKDVPTKFSIEIGEIIEGTPMIKALIVDFYSSIGFKDDPINIIFKNININWK